MSGLASKVVWITGASSGIGEALAYAFAQRGSKLILSARRESELARVRAACPHPTDVHILPVDLEQIDEIPAKAAEAHKLFGTLDILVNNAGITQRSLAIEAPVSVDERILRVDYLAPVALTKAVLPRMIEKKSGRIVVISSVAGFVGTPLRSSYAAAKHALRGFFDSLRAEVWRDGIGVTLVYPGYIRTPITLHALGPDGQPYGKIDPGQQQGMDPEACAKRIVRGIERSKNEIYVGGTEIFAIYLQRFFPGLTARIVRKAKVV